MDDDRVNQSGEDKGICQVGLELTALGHRARHDCRCGGRESPLKHPERKKAAGIVEAALLFCRIGRDVVAVRHEEIRSADELIGQGTVLTVGERVAPGPPDKGSNARIQYVLEQNILRVLGSDATSLQKRKPALHKEN